VRVDLVDPSAFTPPYDRARAAALARAGVDVRLVTSRFAYGDVPAAEGFAVDERFYRWEVGAAGSRARLAAKLVQHVPQMLGYRRASRAADVVHFQWLTVQPLDVHLLPRARPTVLTAHDVLPREPRAGQLRAQRRLYERVEAVVVHSEHGRDRLTRELDIDPAKVHVIAHGAFTHLAALEPALPPELAGVLRRADIVVLPYREIDQSGVLYAALGLGRPLLLSGVGGFPEVAATGAAELVAPNDPDALGAALQGLVDDPARRESLAAAATRAAQTTYSWDEAARRHRALYGMLTGA
jgi:glycosyltransferase involved in cell wall biosynthesis